MKLSYHKTKAIHEEWKDGATLRELCDQYGVGMHTLRRHLRAFELYGRSAWTQYPERVEQNPERVA